MAKVGLSDMGKPNGEFWRNAGNRSGARTQASVQSPEHLIEEGKWWARLGLNQRPLPCEGSALPLSYAPVSYDPTGAGPENAAI
jgi:hypothetical protein